ncbi:ATP-binding protein [Alishewanella jeotgali]|uniref:ATPase AAA n=1 Tax=Alishewanella jeotgali KCTC 22429 TaxID=1129374 RepID=H3Z9U2_9ALTE|nr:ATP-binding protein [Alishewanella jeotgali]EHR42616.1 ATPase AAA [Alishewanella jeotgali KCTC 22429]
MKESLIKFDVREPKISLDKDVILPAHTKRMFNEAIGALKHHKTIYSDWGFGEVDPQGRNMVLNFYGPPGTGKTMAAEALAGILNRNFIHIGISELESKYVGETARNISAAFMEAAMAGALLFFDEADTLLGARLSSVTQGIDNEINAMRSTLLIELERFDGIVVFATNFARNYDAAFVSRIRYHIEFLLPDLEGRKALYKKMLVPGIPIVGEHQSLVQECAELSHGLSGREIRTVLRTALPKALINGVEGATLTIQHLTDAINEVIKSKKDVGVQGRQAMTTSDITISQKLLGLENK